MNLVKRIRTGICMTALPLAFALAGCNFNGLDEFSLERKAPPAPVYSLGATPDSAAGGVMVRRGDTVWDISKRYGVEQRDLIDLNRLSPPYRIVEGQRLKLPAPRYYHVQTGDTLYSISRMFGVDTTSLARVNELKPPYRIGTGWKLTIPSAYARQRPPASVYTPPARQVVVDRVAPVEDVRGEELASLPGRKPDFGNNAASSGATTAARPVLQRSTPGAKFDWPVSGRVVSEFGPKPGGLHNDGINIAAPRGTPVRAVDDGVVVYAGDDLKSFGNMILIRHADGWMTAYAHMDELNIDRNEDVRRGQVLGTVGSSGTVDSPQLHFEVRKGSTAIDPMKYL